MTLHLGNVPASSTLYIPFASYDSNGASVTLSGLAATDIEIYKNGSTTQRSSDAGYALLDTDGIDFDSITGIHGFSIDLSDNTDAGFYAVGSQYWVVVSAVTIDTRTVNFIAATFRIVAAEAITGKPKVDVDAWLGTAAATPTTAGVPEVDVTHVAGTAQTANDNGADINAILADTNELQTDWANGGRLDLLIDAIKAVTDALPDAGALTTIASNISAILTDTGTTLDGKLDAIAGYIDTEIAAIKAKTDSLTFTVAGQVDANIQYVNDVAVTGDGQTGTEWGPA